MVPFTIFEVKSVSEGIRSATWDLFWLGEQYQKSQTHYVLGADLFPEDLTGKGETIIQFGRAKLSKYPSQMPVVQIDDTASLQDIYALYHWMYKSGYKVAR